MRIAVDGRHLTGGRGVARYATRVLRAMMAAAPEQDWRVFVPGRSELPISAPAVRSALGGRAVFGAAALVGRPRLDRLAGGADVVWLPAPSPVAVSRSVPYVVTVHDLSWVARMRDFTRYERLWHRLARLRAQIEGAARVVAVSESTRGALVDWGIDPARVVTVLSGPGLAEDAPLASPDATATPDAAAASPAAPDAAAAPAATGSPAAGYFLAVGALEPRKAPDLLARAFATARARGLTGELVFAGDGRMAGAVAGEGVRVLGWQDDAALRALYAGAIAVVQPAWLEGFGLPPVEAAAHGTPSIVADLPVYAETIGGGALRVAPGDEAGLADALLAVEGDAGLRARLAAAGAAAVAPLSWRRAGAETLAVLRAAGRR